MIKIPFNQKPLSKLSGTPAANPKEGRYTGMIVGIAYLGFQKPNYDPAKPAVPSVGVVVEVAGTQLAKKMAISDHPKSNLCGFLYAALPDPEGYTGDDPLPLTLGRPVAVEIREGRSPYIDSFHRPEEFELANIPQVAESDLIYLEDVEALKGDEGKALLQRLHLDIRKWLSDRDRSR